MRTRVLTIKEVEPLSTNERPTTDEENCVQNAPASAVVTTPRKGTPTHRGAMRAGIGFGGVGIRWCDRAEVFRGGSIPQKNSRGQQGAICCNSTPAKEKRSHHMHGGADPDEK